MTSLSTSSAQESSEEPFPEVVTQVIIPIHIKKPPLPVAPPRKKTSSFFGKEVQESLKKDTTHFKKFTTTLEDSLHAYGSDATLVPYKNIERQTSRLKVKARIRYVLRCPHCQQKMAVSVSKSTTHCKKCGGEVHLNELKKKKKLFKRSTEEAEKFRHNRNLFAHYEILGEIGRGGMGVVYKVLNIEDQKYYALKVLSNDEEVNDERIMRFRREAKAMAQLNHPHIIKVYDFGNFEGQCYFTMDLIEGESVEQWIQKKKKVPERLALQMMIKIAEAVDYAHKKHIIHRDLKPENILINSKGEPYLMDFGLAKIQRLEESRLTQSGLAVGTPAFMSPEQALGDLENVDEVSDVFALGTVLYNMVTGKPPFLGSSPIIVMKKIISSYPLLPRKLNPRLSRGIENIIMKALEKEKKERYQNAGELQQDLQYLLEEKPLIAKNPPSRLGRFILKNRLLLSLLTLSLLCLGILAFSFYSVYGLFPSSAEFSPFFPSGEQLNNDDLPQLKIRVQRLMDSKEYEKALEYWQRIRKVEGESPEYFYGLAICLLHTHNPEAALEQLKHLQTLAPSVKCFFLQASCYAHDYKRDYRLALLTFDKTLEAQEKALESEKLSFLELAQLYLERGDTSFRIQHYEEALQNWQKAKKLNPKIEILMRIQQLPLQWKNQK
jgi:serine/threonine protein kinase